MKTHKLTRKVIENKKIRNGYFPNKISYQLQQPSGKPTPPIRIGIWFAVREFLSKRKPNIYAREDLSEKRKRRTEKENYYTQIYLEYDIYEELKETKITQNKHIRANKQENLIFEGLLQKPTKTEQEYLFQKTSQHLSRNIGKEQKNEFLRKISKISKANKYDLEHYFELLLTFHPYENFWKTTSIINNFIDIPYWEIYLNNTKINWKNHKNKMCWWQKLNIKFNKENRFKTILEKEIQWLINITDREPELRKLTKTIFDSQAENFEQKIYSVWVSVEAERELKIELEEMLKIKTSN